ncbi:MAG: histidinol dehydrogenase [Solirubrobacterales bacterium]|nr:histidinol dehydrogenase [Solirubrobacterales bacterium]
MILRRFDWTAAGTVAAELEEWFGRDAERIDPGPIGDQVSATGDRALRELTARFDATSLEAGQIRIRVDPDEAERALRECDPAVRQALEIAVVNVRLVAEAQLSEASRRVRLPQGQMVTVGEVPVRAAGIYAPGGRAAYPSTVVMGCVPARVAGVDRLVLVSPPGPGGQMNPTTLAAAALCGVDEIYAIGGAQAIYALARGTGTVRAVDVIAGPGNAWVQAAKRDVFGEVGIDSLAGPSDLTVVIDRTVDPEWAALDLCAQAEHGAESPLVAITTEPGVIEPLADQVERISAEHTGVNDCRMALVEAPDSSAAIDLAGRVAPEHLQLMDAESAALAERVTTAGCIFTGPYSATAFGDYLAGSNHVLPTDGTGRFFGPLTPATFRRPTARVSFDAGSARALAGPLAALAESEGLPVHGLSVTARAAGESKHTEDRK